MGYFVFSQIMVAFAFGIGLYAFQHSKREVILKLWFFSALCNTIHFVLLGELSAALFASITASRFLISCYSADKRWAYLFIGLAVVNLTVNYTSLVSVLPFIAIVIGALGAFQHSVLVIRWSMAGGASAWIIHNVLVESPVAVLMEVCFLISNLVGHKRTKKEPNKRL